MGCPKEHPNCKLSIFSDNAASSLLIFFEYMGIHHLEVMDDIQQELSCGNYGACSLMNFLGINPDLVLFLGMFATLLCI